MIYTKLNRLQTNLLAKILIEKASKIEEMNFNLQTNTQLELATRKLSGPFESLNLKMP